VLRTVAEHFSEQPGAMDPLFRADHAEADSDAERLRAVVDQVASLTDHSAWTHYHRLRAGVADML
jgi:dGTPase